MEIKPLYVVIVALMMLCSCDIINPEEEVPGILLVEDVSLTLGPLQGAPTLNVTHVQVAVDGLSLGGFPLPARIPIYEENARVLLEAAVQANGRSASAVSYPFYTRLDQVISVSSGETVTRALDLSYSSSTLVRYVEGFEFGNTFTVDLDEDLDTGIEVTSESAASGNTSGKATLTQEHDRLSVATAIAIDDIPANGSAVYIELDYRNEIPFSIGLVGINGGEEIPVEFILLNPSEDWNKVYVDITQLILDSRLSSYRILLRALYDDGAGDEADIFIDNVKLLHF